MPKEEGTFWIPESPERAVRGILEFGPETRPLLILLGNLRSAVKVVRHVSESGEYFSLEADDDPPSFTIYGYIQSKPRRVTLVGCTVIHESEVAGLTVALDRQVVSPLHLVQGAHVDGGKDQPYDAMQVRVNNIDEWANLPGFAINEGNRELAYLKYEKPDACGTTTAAGLSVEVIETLTRSFPRPSGGHISRECWIRVSGFEPQSFKEISTRFVTPVASGLGILIGTASPITRLQLRAAGRWCDIWFSNMASYASDRLHLREIFLPLPLCGIEVVGNFIDLAELTGPATPVIADSDSLLRKGTLETQVLELTTIGEGLHRALFDEESRFTEQEATRIRGLIGAAIVEEDRRHRQIIEGFLSHMEEPSYRTRIRQLANLAEELLPGVSGRTNRWVNLTDRARNAFAHRTVGYLDEEKIDEYYVVSRSLLWIFRAVILIQADANSQECADWVQNNNRYRQYLRNMRGALPKVFDKESS